ncbi:MAG: PEP-CTERM sorting domain-containing protein [Planctomycetes bacterium HGW-Planctomycetes-1]|nr:MAG: PEP-CTERM sorting domain-containing protein [Planctomycetes bacterium HGW-Planctomycetes-1]
MKTKSILVVIILTYLLDLAINSFTLAASFQYLGPSTTGYGISGDGSVVVGRPNYRWTETEGIEFLGPGYGVATSFDGSVVVGKLELGANVFRWTESGGIQDLGFGGGGYRSCDVSADGSVVVGGNYRWTETEGTLDLGGTAYGISGDGSVIVGEGFYWTETSGKQDLAGQGVAASADGSVIVGDRYGYNDDQNPHRQAFRWTETGGMQELGWDGSWATDVSSDGSVIVGCYYTGGYFDEAFIWDADNGMRSIKSVLESVGLNVSDWQLEFAYGISADGLTIVGTGWSPNGDMAWIATIPEPTTFLLLGFGGLILRKKR